MMPNAAKDVLGFLLGAAALMALPFGALQYGIWLYEFGVSIGLEYKLAGLLSILGTVVTGMAIIAIAVSILEDH